MDNFYAIAEPNRRKILQMLAQQGSMTASQISKRFKSSAAAVSQHLKVLLEARAVSVHKQGQKRIYRLNPDSLIEIDRWLNSLTQQWQQRLDNLSAVFSENKNKKPNNSQLKKKGKLK